MNAAQLLMIGAIRVYRWVLSPAKNLVFGPLGRCRFQPSCSEYACQAIGQWGVFRGGSLALKRLGRCHPWGGCGWDPVPELPVDPAGRCSCHNSRSLIGKLPRAAFHKASLNRQRRLVRIDA